jgi:hypothetical protein
MQTINTGKPALRKFGITMAIALMVITIIILLRHKYSILPTAVAALLFSILAWIMPLALKPLYIVWMRLAFILSWFNTRVLLITVFYLFISPIAMIMKLCGRDLLDQRIDKAKKTYWLPKDKNWQIAQDYERRF